eukprot:scaffold764_cov363-Pavlova_lutheri.AAC.10
MVCPTCEKQLGKVICPEPWKERNRSTGKKGPENKLLANQKRWKPYTDTCKVCKQVLHQPGKYCLGCAYERGICSRCGKQIIDTSMYRMSDSAPKRKKGQEDEKKEPCQGENESTEQETELALLTDGRSNASVLERHNEQKAPDRREAHKGAQDDQKDTVKDWRTKEGNDAKPEWIYDPKSGYYYDASSGYHYDPSTQLYYDSRTQRWIKS